MEQELEILEGTVQFVTFRNSENGYAILKMHAETGELVTVVGTIPMAMAGERLIVTGKWTTHSSYGRQFEAEFLERLLPQRTDEILAYLSSRAIKGIGPVTAKRIVDRFGASSLDILENEPEKLTQIEGISRKKAFDMSGEFRRQSGVRRLMEFLAAHSLPAELAMRLYRIYGDTALEVVQEDPYRMAEPDIGAPFSKADAFALEIGIGPDDSRRVQAGILFELSHNLGNGHVFIPESKLLDATVQLLGLPYDCVETALDRLREQERIACDTLAGIAVCYLPDYFEAETYVAERLSKMAVHVSDTPWKLETALRSVCAERRGGYAEYQKEAIRAAATQQLLIVTGGPGTGKTTTMAGILRLYDLLGMKTRLAAPTGRAAKRLTECTGREATTIHRLLESQFDPDSGMMQFLHDESEPIKTDAVIVDEASMIDLLLMQSLLKALRPDCRLILVGDPDQLPSVGAGNVFSDLIRSGIARTVRLTEIFRQAQESLIVMNAHAVNHGGLPELGVKNRDFFFLRRRDGESLVQTVQELCAVRLPKNMGIQPADIQVLSPTRKGPTGTGNLNRQLQAVLNPPSPDKRERSHGDFVFREGDRVMQIRNNYDMTWKKEDGTAVGVGVFNGDIGVIRSIDPQAETVLVGFDERIAEYGFGELGDLEPAYAMTVHKSQGSEYPAVILTALGGSELLLTRSILYTAITRARSLLIVVGAEEVIAAMVRNDRRQRRYSGLKLRLEAAKE